jgi:hypothetical protein
LRTNSSKEDAATLHIIRTYSILNVKWRRKMVNLNKISMAMLASLALFIYGCGGGGGGGGGNNNAPGTASQSAAASSKAIISALGAATTGANPSISGKPSLKARKANISNAAQVRQALNDFKVSLVARKQKTLQGVTNIPSQCITGTGNIQMDDGNTPSDPTDDSFSQVFNDCVQSFEGLTFTQDGSMTLTTSNGGDTFTMIFDNFGFRSVDSSATVEFISDGTMSFSGSNVACGEDTFLENGSFSMNFTTTTRVDLGNNGTFETNDSSVMDNLTMTIAEANSGEPDCTPGAITLTMNGGTSNTSANAEDNFSAEFDDFEMTLTPETRDGVEGEVLSMNGTITVTSDCASGTFTISTPAGDEPFIPLDGPCPVDGTILVASGGTTTAVTFTSTGGVQIDEGNNGSIEQTFDDCEDSEVCSSSEV